MSAKLRSVDTAQAQHLEVLKSRQESRRRHLREIEDLIAKRELEIQNLEALLGGQHGKV